jgi:hypothetical protein
MAHDPNWHAEYARLELAANVATEELRAARDALRRRRPVAGAQARYDAALEQARRTGAARFDFEMAAVKIVDIATLAPAEWARALLK